MKKLLLFLVLCFFSISLQAQQKPKLVVGIVVDQMKAEYLNRFYADFSENGFKKLVEKGYSFQNVHFNFMPTYTGPGHASIYTGTTPSVNGIVGNNWFDRSLQKEVYCVDDDTVTVLGDGAESEGKMSPKKLQSTTITDELKLATNFKGKVIGISLKDRGAILPAGHFADWAFWFSNTGAFVSSTFYGKELPNWVTQFNNEKHFSKYLEKDWTLLKDKSVYNESLNDNNPYEGKLFKKTPFFPYNMKEMYANNTAGVLKSTPFGNNLVIDFAKKAIEKENLGADEITDFLTISFSSTDYIGHILGPRSIELQDTYLRLDETIADFLTYLDKTVGKDNYLLFLTADHAGAENVTYLKDNKYEVDNIKTKKFEKDLTEFSIKTYGIDVIQNYSNFNLFFDKDSLKVSNLDLLEVKQTFKSFLYTQNFIKRVYTEEEILAASDSDFYLSFIAKGYDPVQNGDIVILEKPGFIEYSATGTTHGSPYTYDTHVPLLFYGNGIKKGTSFNKKYITQIAPTLALKLKITLPNGTDAEVLEEILNQ